MKFGFIVFLSIVMSGLVTNKPLADVFEFDSVDYVLKQKITLITKEPYAPGKIEYLFGDNHSVTFFQNIYDEAKDVKNITWGPAPGDKPFLVLKTLAVKLYGKEYKLDVSGMYDAWIWQAQHVKKTKSLKMQDNKSLLRLKCTDKDRCRLTGLFSGEAGGYEVQWEINNGKSTRIFVKSAH